MSDHVWLTEFRSPDGTWTPFGIAGFDAGQAEAHRRSSATQNMRVREYAPTASEELVENVRKTEWT